jgi:hypothetical protein
MIKEIIYKQEYNRLLGLKAQSRAFNALLQRFPEEDIDARLALRRAFARSARGTKSVNINLNTGRYEIQEYMPPVLDMEVLAELAEENPQLSQRIDLAYFEFLAETMNRTAN